MKTKNVILGIAAAVFAVGGVFATSFVPAQKVLAPNCRAIVDVECGNAGPRQCEVVISSTVYQAYNNDCSVALTTTSTEGPIPTTFE